MTTIDDFLAFCENAKVDTSRLKVIIYILEHVDPQTCIFEGSYDSVARGANVSFSTVSKTMQLAQSEGLMSQISPACWKINENPFVGDDSEDAFLIRNYCEKKAVGS